MSIIKKKEKDCHSKKGQLKHEKQFLLKVINVLNDMVYVLNDNEEYVLWNKKMEKVSGYSSSEMLHIKPSDLFRKEDYKRFAVAIKKTFIQGEAELQADLLTKKGKIIPMLFSGRRARDNQGKNIIVGVGKDITNIKRVEEKLRESEGRYRTLFDKTMDAVFLHEIEGKEVRGKFIEVNEIACNRLGYSKKELLSLSPKEIDDPNSKVGLKEISKKLSKGENVIFESVHVSKKGIRIPVEINANLVVLPNGKKAILSIVRDITERKKIEEEIKNLNIKLEKKVEEKTVELIEKEKFLASIVDNIPNMIFVKDADKLRFKMFNKAGERLLGTKVKNLIGKNDYDFFPKKQADFFVQKDRDVLNAKKMFDIPQEPIKTPHGERILHTKKIPILDHNNKPIYLLGISEDITEKKEAEKKLRESEKKFESLTENTPDCYKLVDLKGKIIYVNSSAVGNHGVKTKEDLIGKKIWEIPPTYISKQVKKHFELARKGKKIDADYVIPIKDGSNKYVLRSYIPLFNSQMKIENMQVICRNITPIKKAEEKLRVSLEYETLLRKISSTYNKNIPFDDKINFSLETIGTYFDISRAYLFKDFNDRKNTRNTHEWGNIGVLPKIKNLQDVPYSMIPSWKKILGRKGKVESSDINTLPKDLQRILKPQKIKSILVLPIFMGGKEYGFIGFDNCMSNRAWTTNELNILKTISYMISNLLEEENTKEELRKSHDELEFKVKERTIQLSESEEKFRTIFQSSKDAMMTLEPPTWGFASGNPATLSMFKAKDEKIFISKGPGQVSPKYQPDGQLSSEKAKKMIEKAMKDGYNFFEWTHKRMDGEEFPATVLLTRLKLNGKDILQATVRDISEQKKTEQELKKKMHGLEVFHMAAVDREMKIIELKKRVKELENNPKRP